MRVLFRDEHGNRHLASIEGGVEIVEHYGEMLVCRDTIQGEHTTTIPLADEEGAWAALRTFREFVDLTKFQGGT